MKPPWAVARFLVNEDGEPCWRTDKPVDAERFDYVRHDIYAAAVAEAKAYKDAWYKQRDVSGQESLALKEARDV